MTVQTQTYTHAGQWLATTPFQTLLADVRERARTGEFDRQRRLPADVVTRLRELGVYRALVPQRFGGDERSPMAFCEMVEALSAADGSTGWVASFGMGPFYLAALPPATIEKIFAQSCDPIFAGGIFPPQPVDRADGGFQVKGRWKYSSGCTGATVLGVGIAPREGDKLGLPRMAVMPRDNRIHIDETWNTVGLLATGSHDLVIDKEIFIAEDWTFVRGGKPQIDDLLFRYPSLSFATQVLSVVGLGVARAAIDILRDIACGRPSVTGAPMMSDRPLTQFEIAKADAALRAARAFFYEAMEQAWDQLQTQGEVTPEQTSLLRLSSTHATRTAAQVARACQMLAGMDGIYIDHPLARCVNDTQAVTQHAFMGDITYQSAGAMLFGKSPLPGYL
ncbi:acyl-CoA dehydrogenase family protein [Alcaligenaceae bacterium CGII-47]|nr:acyl-CoA dehydrogenase family protein [Alcaligenaceae bacterium CGII-47]